MTIPGSVGIGDIMLFPYYAKVKRVAHIPVCQLLLENLDTGEEFQVQGDSLIETAKSADRYSETIKLPKTEVAQILVRLYNTPFTVVYVKANGEERTLRGRLVHPEPLLGRSQVQDFDKGNAIRLVDHRTLVSLVANGKKYAVK